MGRKTKAELEAENKLLREIAGGGSVITGCVFNGSASNKQCKAVIEIAKTMRVAAEALKGSPALVINQVNDYE